ncbi:MAG: type I-E CRISPR-associated protein Cas5/CasD [Clostridia bacterium]|nr:type I-E CRISPR-associated protein Cas5/CasD [Peptococcus niger]MDU7244476.1 type I-E CRISPR-associated protein Cas5/CasD [Clostridiales bacterium]MDU7506192.1 type I-E CRISPR-associated protein Cas5/CasD [Clostridia bacterium]
MKTILLKCAGPLQAWGTDSYFETRMTDLYPSKSGIIGLLAACCGYRREEDGPLVRLNELDFAVRVDRSGSLLRDYHTAQKYTKKGTLDGNYVTNRYYLQDAVFIVALGHRDEAFIDELVAAIRAPYFQPFMGRRSLPVPVDFLLAVCSGGVIENLTNLPKQTHDKPSDRLSEQLTLYADADLLGTDQWHWRKDRPISFSQKNRRFANRAEAVAVLDVPLPAPATDHDAFKAIGG